MGITNINQQHSVNSIERKGVNRKDPKLDGSAKDISVFQAEAENLAMREVSMVKGGTSIQELKNNVLNNLSNEAKSSGLLEKVMELLDEVFAKYDKNNDKIIDDKEKKEKETVEIPDEIGKYEKNEIK